ncbi:MAG: hypothetical protein M1830_008052 [Pleopsidium flavum]|nr:MAG: hypothetical protein M1830_008052 [Pleopsidium flavum]
MSTRPESVASPGLQVRGLPGAFPGEGVSPTAISSQYSLSQAVHARRAEYTRSHKIRVKVGTWNVAALSGTEKDIGGWFVHGKGISEGLSGLSISEDDDSNVGEDVMRLDRDNVEGVAEQEARRTKKQSTIPKNDPGLLPGGDDVGIYALGLQEIVDISSATEALRPYNDPHPAKKWKRAIADALPRGYQLIAEQQLIGLLLLIYASPTVAPTITSVSTTSVGTGLMGYMGNKGAVTARIILGETTRLVFINCHLAAGTEKGTLERRNWDAAQILSRTKFDPVTDSGVVEDYGEGIGDEDFAFWFGDLNYRLAQLPGDDVRRLLMLHTRNEYDIGQRSEQKIEKELSKPTHSMIVREREARNRSSEDSSSSSATAVDQLSQHSAASSTTLPTTDAPDPYSDPTSLQTTLSSLLPHDQLHLQMRSRQAFYDGWQEGPIDFLPTYKYDVGSVGMFDSGEKKRGPSWCDRILYRTRRDKLEYERRFREEEEARRRDAEMEARGLDRAGAEDEGVLYDYDPETDGAGDDESYAEAAVAEVDPEIVVTREGFEDKLHLDYYTSHQRVLSSDHKPLDAVFTLVYEAVMPELKAKVHQEVVRELDKAENEGRPVVTIVVDHHHRDHDEVTNSGQNSASFEGVNFGEVRYAHSKICSITIANTGRVPATIGFVDRPVEQGKPSAVSPPWLTIEFDRQRDNHNANSGALREYTLQPGDAVNVELTLHIDDIRQVRALNVHRERIEDILVLRVHNGRDHFIPVRATWLQSSFGRSLDKLIRIPEGGVRRLQNQRPSGSGNGDDNQGVKWSAPRELFRLTEAIEELVERCVAEWNMTSMGVKPPWEEVVGWPFAEQPWWRRGAKESEELKLLVREALDTDCALSPLFPAEVSSLRRAEVVAESLVAFLRSLEDGIITEALWIELDKIIIAQEKVKKQLPDEDKRALILDVLSTSPTHSVSFSFLTFMLTHIVSEIAPMHQPAIASPRPSTDTGSRGRARTLSQDPVIARRQQIERTFATTFAEVMIRAPVAMKEKEKKASEERRKEVVEVFLRARTEEEA